MSESRLFAGSVYAQSSFYSLSFRILKICTGRRKIKLFVLIIITQLLFSMNNLQLKRLDLLL